MASNYLVYFVRVHSIEVTADNKSDAIKRASDIPSVCWREKILASKQCKSLTPQPHKTSQPSDVEL
jgi:hypothetical protein